MSDRVSRAPQLPRLHHIRQTMGDNYENTVVGKMAEFRTRKVLCDVVICSDGQQFPVHKLILAASSSFFRSLFTLDMSERHEKVIKLDNIEPDILRRVLDYIYNGDVPSLEAQEARELYMAADYLILPGLKTLTIRALAGSLSSEDCLRTMLWAHHSNCRNLFAQAFRFVLDHFRNVVQTDDFLRLPAKELRIFLNSDNLRIMDEEDVYMALKRWVESNKTGRRGFYEEFFPLIRFEHLSLYFLKQVVLPDVVRFGDGQMYQDFTHMLESFADSKNTDYVINPVQPPRRHVAIVVTILSPDVYCYIPTTREWREMAPVPTLRIYSTSALCQGLLYNVGGLSVGEDSSHVVECLNPVANTWSRKASLPVPTRAAGLAVLGQFLYVIGGKSNNARLNTVQRYDSSKNCWDIVAPLHVTRSGPATVSCHSSIYAIGGRQNEEIFLKSVERYCPKSNTWSWVGSMHVPRASASATCIRDSIYVIGGVSSPGVSLTSCEVYHIHQDTWNMIAPTTVPRSYGGIAPFNECILVYGGEEDDTFHDTVEFYDIEENTWQIIDKMPKREKFVDCCCMFISKDLLPIFPQVN